MNSSAQPSVGFKRAKNALEIVASLSIIAAAAVTLWSHYPKRTEQRIAIGASATLGEPSAPAVVIEYSDFECPFCRRFASEQFPDFRRRFIQTGSVRWIFKHLPIAVIHKQAFDAAVAAECGRRQGRFWEIHDKLFAGPVPPKSDLPDLASRLGLDQPAFEGCLSADGQETVRKDLADARGLKITSTPTFLVGIPTGDGSVLISQRLAGLRDQSELEGAIESLLDTHRVYWVRLAAVSIATFAVGAWIWRRRSSRAVTAN